MNSKDIYVIIVTYNGERWIERCLNSIYSSSIKAIPIVIDNGSSDYTVSIIKEKFPDTIFLESGGNVGFGKANNIGIKYALEKGCEYVYLLNQDAWVDLTVFETLLDLMSRYPDFAILSPVQITASRKKVDSNFMKHDINDSSCPELKQDLLLNRTKEIYEIDAAMAAHWMLRLSAIQKVGLFSDAFPHYGEDNNLINRFHYFRYKVGVCPYVFAVHDREERKRTPEQSVKMLYIHTIRHFHNLENQSFGYKWGFFLKAIIKIIISKVPISIRFETLKRTLAVPLNYKKYLKAYRNGEWNLKQTK